MKKKIINFGVVGILATFIEYCLLIIFKELIHIDVIVASAIAYSCSLFFNYIFSMRYVFKDRKYMSIKREFMIFLMTSLIGLLLNQIVMILCIQLFNIYYILAKVIATSIVLIWNFFSRYKLLENH